METNKLGQIESQKNSRIGSMPLHMDESTFFFLPRERGSGEGGTGGRISGSELGVGFLALSCGKLH